MSDLTAVDCQTFAGGFAVGAVEAGFNILAKREEAGAAGVAIYQSNKHVLGDVPVQATNPIEWEPVKAHMVFGNPPCSAFSNMASSGARFDAEWRSSKNACMTYLVDYAAKCDPEIVIFESVQGAFTKGREFMQSLHRKLEKLTGDEWALTHVLHRVQDLGGVQNRPRYFWVASRVPFGIDPESIKPPVTLWDRIGDLADKPLGSVDGHYTLKSKRANYLAELASQGQWAQGERSALAWTRTPEIHVQQPDKQVTGFASVRLKADAQCRVITGIAPEIYVHPTENRVLTFREIARVMGFPDSWNVEKYAVTGWQARLFGKGICVEAAHWISTAAAQSLSGNPGSEKGVQIGEREFLINTKEMREMAPKLF